MKKEKIPKNTTALGYAIIGLAQQIDSILNQDTRKKILESLKKESKTISEIRKELQLSYSTIWDHIKVLKDIGIIDISQEKRMPGKPIIVSIHSDTLEEREKRHKELDKILDKYTKK